MSLESAKAFLAKIRTDEDFGKKVAVCKDSDERWALVKAEGFDFTQEEFDNLKNQLSDYESDMVVSGSGTSGKCYVGGHGLQSVPNEK